MTTATSPPKTPVQPQRGTPDPGGQTDSTQASKNASPATKAQAPVQRPFSVRGFTSMLLVMCALMLLISGLCLYVAPRGRVANWISWTALSLSRQQWVAIHINASVLFAAVTATHLAMNWSRLVGYVKRRARAEINMKRELASALAVACAVLAGTLYELPPINLPVDFKYILRDSWEQTDAGRGGISSIAGGMPAAASPRRSSEI